MFLLSLLCFLRIDYLGCDGRANNNIFYEQNKGFYVFTLE